MDTSERVVRAAMLGEITGEEADLAMAISLYVEKTIFCSVTGLIMDSRSAYAVQILNDGKWDTFSVFHEAFVDPSKDYEHEAARTRMITNYGEEGSGWRWVDAVDIWDKIAS